MRCRLEAGRNSLILNTNSRARFVLGPFDPLIERYCAPTSALGVHRKECLTTVGEGVSGGGGFWGYGWLANGSRGCFSEFQAP